MLTETEENYLKLIYKLEVEESKQITTNLMAEVTHTKPSSVTEMLKRLGKKKYINYKAYKGVTLTNDGRIIGQSITRKHRLWETYLVSHLGFNWEEIHEIAEELEHIKSEKLIKKIDEILNYPKIDPHGEPIPNSSGFIVPSNLISLFDMKPSTKGVISGVKNCNDKMMIEKLNILKLLPNNAFKVIDKDLYDYSLRIEISGQIIKIPQEVAKIVLVSKTKILFNLF